MRNIREIGLAVLCGAVTTLALFPAPANAWGPVYEFGDCTIDTGTQRETFECYVSTRGETDSFSMEIIRSVSGNPSRDSLVGTYYAPNSAGSDHMTFEWSDGAEERVQASDFNNPEDWAFWIQGGCGIGFQRLTLDM
ncbi:hypothetical protein [Leptolyngbya sp. FACHB-16]|uniref:hypothetical protein n=2 Tax=unclassified Leptolyngbya TaxID=2650499 RepID=UPI001682AACC|nr:hypothetical protein [Leptolyngbya sp. FACHB-16]MBD1910667.1 hypothetical protein [Leptolyngbya sp. FACHB-8]